MTRSGWPSGWRALVARGRTAAVRCAACVTAAAVLAGCTGGGHPARRAGPAALRRGFAIAGGGPGIGFIAVSGGPGGRPRISAPAIPPASSALVVQMPLEGYEEEFSVQQNVLAAASNLLLQHCMTGRGFEYPLPAQASNGLAALQEIEQDPVGLTSTVQARSLGFTRPKASAGLGGIAPFAVIYGPAFFQLITSEGRAWVVAMFGFGPGGPVGPVARGRAARIGCLQLTQTELFGSTGPPIDPMIGLAAQSLNWARTDPRVLAVDRAWSACMTRHGYQYGAPTQAEQRRWPNPPDKAEIAVAVADVSCKTQTNLPNTLLAVEAAYQQAAMAQNMTTLVQLQTRFGRQLQRLQTLLAAAS
jgi:hypothetical protein